MLTIDKLGLGSRQCWMLEDLAKERDGLVAARPASDNGKVLDSLARRGLAERTGTTGSSGLLVTWKITDAGRAVAADLELRHQ